MESNGLSITDIDLIVNPAVVRTAEMSVFLHLEEESLLPKVQEGQEVSLFYYLRYFFIQLLRIMKKATVTELPSYVKGLDAKRTEIINPGDPESVNISALSVKIKALVEITECVPKGALVEEVKSSCLDGQILDGYDEHVEHYNVFVIYPENT